MRSELPLSMRLRHFKLAFCRYSGGPTAHFGSSGRKSGKDVRQNADISHRSPREARTWAFSLHSGQLARSAPERPQGRSRASCAKRPQCENAPSARCGEASLSGLWKYVARLVIDTRYYIIFDLISDWLLRHNRRGVQMPRTVYDSRRASVTMFFTPFSSQSARLTRNSSWSKSSRSAESAIAMWSSSASRRHAP